MEHVNIVPHIIDILKSFLKFEILFKFLPLLVCVKTSSMFETASHIKTMFKDLKWL